MPLALLALAVGAFGIGTTEFVTMGLLPNIADDLHISIPTAGHLVSAYALGVVIGAPLLAALTSRMSRRTVLIALMALFVAGNALSAFAPGNGSLLAARFLSGLPHGAFFGVGAVVATSMVAPERKARSVSLMFLGLTVANVAGVPAATLMGQHLGWRATFLAVGAIGLAAIAALALLIPHDHTHATATGLRGELAALRSVPVWLALGTTVAGFGALFAAYSYITPMLTDTAGFAEANVTLLLALFGVGATAGNLLGGRLADHSLRGTLYGGLTALAAVLALFPVLMHAQWSAALAVALLGMAAFITGSPLQLMVMEKASTAPSLASSANQAAFNLANAGGAWIGGLTLAAGLGTTSPALAGAALAVLGVGVAAVAHAVDRGRPGGGRVVAGHVPEEAAALRR
ncbi:MFS transporter [Streptomyces sp. LP11]|uniref:MFS transporter n=1 Tax=Streptomyces pyxinicus TaxID=2970331 RepID=A0ABT2BAX3_9ACTN|nr:MFS transporter [Streptomyces sp. LP11]MCS0605235.1 MFS transporter [Streptomyces sp. LP11]